MKDSDSFWADIKNLEAQLAKSPDSLCFARLAEVYLKVGLIDDALHVARLGTAKHPRYLSGQKALALACYAKGMNAEALGALELVTEALPEDVASQKLLGRLLADEGRQEDACQAFKTALEFAPDDAECRIELQALERSLGVTSAADDDDEIIEDLEILDEIEIVDEDETDLGFSVAESAEELAPAAGLVHDPLSTGTLAELYVKQGFIHKALEIYRTILADNPDHAATAERVAELERMDSPPEVPPAFEYTFEEDAEAEEEMAVAATPVFESAPAFEAVPAFEPEPVVADEPFFAPEPVAEVAESVEGFSPEFQMDSAPEPAQEFTFSALEAVVAESRAAQVSPQGVADNALSTLEGWLENIRRIKSCR